MAQALLGRPGRPPGKNQGESVQPMTAWLRRTSACWRDRYAMGAGRSTGTAPGRMRTAASVASMRSAVRRESAAGHPAWRSNSGPARRSSDLSVVVQQAAGAGPAGLDVNRRGGAVASLGRDGEIAGDPLGEGPGHEMACLLAKTGVAAGRPALKVGPAAGGKGQVVAREPVQERDGRPQMLPRDLELAVRGALASAVAAKPSQEVPGRVPEQDSPFLDGRVGGDEVLHMPFEEDRLLVAFRQDFGDDEDAAEVFDDLAFGEFVQDFVGEGAAASRRSGLSSAELPSAPQMLPTDPPSRPRNSRVPPVQHAGQPRYAPLVGRQAARTALLSGGACDQSRTGKSIMRSGRGASIGETPTCAGDVRRHSCEDRDLRRRPACNTYPGYVVLRMCR